MIAVSCNSNADLYYISANQVSINQNGNLEIIGTSEMSSGKKYIKSPFISIYTDQLERISNNEYKTSTTANNPRLFSHQNGKKTLSYYKPISFGDANERSHLIELDKDYNLKDEIIFGQTDRIHEVIGFKEEYIALKFNRRKNQLGLKGIGKSAFETPFILSEEPGVPTDLEVARNGSFLFCGTQNDFDYPDGHSYNEKATFGFIGKFDQLGNVLKHDSYKHDEHVFFNDIELTNKYTIVTGTKQLNGSSMNLLLVCYDDNLQLKYEKTLLNEGFQYGVKTIFHEQYFYTLIKDENLGNHKTNFSLMKSDSLFQPQWVKKVPSEKSTEPIDFLILENHIYCVANAYLQNKNSIQAEIYKISMDGELIKKQAIQ